VGHRNIITDKEAAMHFLDKRVNVICEELKKLKVKQKFAIDEWSYKEGNYIHPEDAEKDLTP
jgi:alpha-mannosidase